MKKNKTDQNKVSKQEEKKKKRNELTKELCAYGYDIVLIFLVILFFEVINITFTGVASVFIAVLLIYAVVRTLFIKHVLIIILMNFLVSFIIFSAIGTVRFAAESGIYKSAVILFLCIIFIILQVFAIIYRSFTYAPGTLDKSKKGFRKVVEIMFFVADNFIYNVQIIIGIIYPIILTVIIILIFSSFYNSVNMYFDISSNITNGVIDVSTGARLLGTEFSASTSDSIKSLFDNRVVYFTSISYFTIGYGELIPKGTAVEFIVILEALISNVVNIGFFAIYSALLYEKVIKKQKI